jgi:hypothetical protein
MFEHERSERKRDKEAFGYGRLAIISTRSYGAAEKSGSGTALRT